MGIGRKGKQCETKNIIKNYSKYIINFIEERGKVTISIIPQILNLSLDLIESRINLVCQKSTIIRNNNILISSNHLKGVVQSIKQKLEIEGVANLDEIGIEN